MIVQISNELGLENQCFAMILLGHPSKLSLKEVKAIFHVHFVVITKVSHFDDSFNFEVPLDLPVV